MEYRTYLESKQWADKRREWFKSHTDASCYQCGTKNQLEIHHRSYKRIGRERPSDLISLCLKCHADIHGHLSIYHPKMRASMLFDALSVVKKDRKHIPATKASPVQKPALRTTIIRKRTVLASTV
jgi:hypothetical protein